MLAGKYTFQCVFNRYAFLPPYKGSAFRGAFGHSLRHVACAVKKDDCRSCLLAARCVYAKAMEVLDSKGPKVGHPYIIEPPLSQKREYIQGDGFDFNLILLGDINDYFPFFVYAVERMGEIGVGRRIEGVRGKFQIKDIIAGGESIYVPASKRLSGQYVAEHIKLSQLRENRSGNLSLEFLTPLRFKSGNNISARLDFTSLVRCMLRRISSIMNTYGQGEPDIDYRGLLQRSEAVRTTSERLYWQSWSRYSNRQNASTSLSGIMGTISFKGEIGEFLPLMELARFLHVGKQSTFGLGLFKYDWQAD